MARMVTLLAALSVISSAWCYSSGAPDTVCDDMTPKHPYEPQKSKLPYKVQLSQTNVKPEGTVDITISGKAFKGFLVQVRNGNKAIGNFKVESNKNAKPIKCHGTANSAVTHSNASEKSSVSLKWQAPKTKGEYTVFATVAADGAEFWAKAEVGKINVK